MHLKIRKNHPCVAKIESICQDFDRVDPYSPEQQQHHAMGGAICIGLKPCDQVIVKGDHKECNWPQAPAENSVVKAQIILFSVPFKNKLIFVFGKCGHVLSGIVIEQISLFVALLEREASGLVGRVREEARVFGWIDSDIGKACTHAVRSAFSCKRQVIFSAFGIEDKRLSEDRVISCKKFEVSLPIPTDQYLGCLQGVALVRGPVKSNIVVSLTKLKFQSIRGIVINIKFSYINIPIPLSVIIFSRSDLGPYNVPIFTFSRLVGVADRSCTLRIKSTVFNQVLWDYLEEILAAFIQFFPNVLSSDTTFGMRSWIIILDADTSWIFFIQFGLTFSTICQFNCPQKQQQESCPQLHPLLNKQINYKYFAEKQLNYEVSHLRHLTNLQLQCMPNQHNNNDQPLAHNVLDQIQQAVQFTHISTMPYFILQIFVNHFDQFTIF